MDASATVSPNTPLLKQFQQSRCFLSSKMNLFHWLFMIWTPLMATAFQPFIPLSSQHQQSNTLKRRQALERNIAPTARAHATTLSSSSSSSSALYQSLSNNYQQHRDVVIVGGGLAGLSAALYLSKVDPSRHVTILDRHDCKRGPGKTAIASYAAAGMLAPNSERLPRGPLLDLCLESRQMFGEFGDWVEQMAKSSGKEGSEYLPDKEKGGDSEDLEPWQIGYVGTGGFVAPAFAGDSVATWAPPDDLGSGVWLDAYQVRELEPCLHPDVVGGWWFPEDASVDARRLTYSLRAACVAAGVQLLTGPEYEISSLDLTAGTCQGLQLKNGCKIQAQSVLLATGAWMRQLLPVPIESHKGQSLSLRMPRDQPPVLRRVLFAQDSYIVPKADGRIVIGATVEAGSFDANVTPAGMMHILTHALQLVPSLAHLPIEETWAGLRPTTPDKGPILGKTPWDNVFVAGGYWRNGVLLAPKTGQLMAQLIAGQDLSPSDQALMEAFAWDRFTVEGGGKLLGANARYASQMHPIHTRKSGAGVAASVGTELGSYSTAPSAKEERQRDRQLLFGGDEGSDTGDSAFEKAAALGKSDGGAYTIFDKVEKYETVVSEPSSIGQDPHDMQSYEGSADAITVGSAAKEQLQDVYESIRANKVDKSMSVETLSQDSDLQEQPDPGFRIFHVDEVTGEEREVPPYTSPGEFLASINKETVDNTNDTSDSLSTNDLDTVYKSIQANKETARKGPTWANLLEDDSDEAEERPDPGFRIYHVDEATGEEREVPPYTSPEEFLQQIKQEKSMLNNQGDVASDPGEDRSSTTPIPTDSDKKNGYNEKTFDGYTVIEQANSRSSRHDELEAMREARQKNRLDQTDVGKIGVMNWEDVNNA